MKYLSKLTKLTLGGLIAAGMASSSSALTLNDPGVVGTIEVGTQNASVPNEREWANYLLALGANATVTADGNSPLDGNTENYATSSTDYNGTLNGGTQDDTTTYVGNYTYVMAKYDGQNAGYVLFYVPALAASGYNIPQFAYDIWGNPNQYALSHFTGYGGPTTVPDGGTSLALLGLALAGLGVMRRKLG